MQPFTRLLVMLVSNAHWLLFGLIPLACHAQAQGAYTNAGTWVPNKEEADMVEAIVDRDERWERSLAGKEEWLKRPLQPPGLLRSGMGILSACIVSKHTLHCLVRQQGACTGVMELSVAMMEVRSRQRSAAADAVLARRQAQAQAGRTLPASAVSATSFSGSNALQTHLQARYPGPPGMNLSGEDEEGLKDLRGAGEQFIKWQRRRKQQWGLQQQWCWACAERRE